MTAALVIATTMPALTACTSGGSAGAGSRPGDRQSARLRDTVSVHADAPNSTSTPTQDKVSSLRIDITIDGQHFTGMLRDSAASRDLIAQLPQTVQMRDHGGVEKTGRLRVPLSLAGQPSGADPAVGDVGYYAPGRDLVLYYGDQSYYEGIVILGHLAGDAAQRLARIAGPVIADVRRDP